MTTNIKTTLEELRAEVANLRTDFNLVMSELREDKKIEILVSSLGNNIDINWSCPPGKEYEFCHLLFRLSSGAMLAQISDYLPDDLKIVFNQLILAHNEDEIVMTPSEVFSEKS